MVTVVVDYLDRGLFKINMDIVAADQGKDYREKEASVIKGKQNPNLSRDEWRKLELAANHAFDQLWNYTK